MGRSSSLTGLAKKICCRNHGWARSVSPKALERTKQDSRDRDKVLHSVLRMLWKELWEILLTQWQTEWVGRVGESSGHTYKISKQEDGGA